MLKALDGHAESGVTHDLVVVDEGQDFPPEFFCYARRHIAGVLSVFADEEQALSERQTTLLQIKQAGGLPDPILLSANHRNSAAIAALAAHFHAGTLPVAAVQRLDASGDLPRLVCSLGVDHTCESIVKWYKNRGGSIGVVVSRNHTGSQIETGLRRLLKNVRVDFYTHERRNEESINVLGPGITVLNTKSVKGQEFDALFLLELERFIPCCTPRALRVMYMLCSRPRDNLWMVYGPDPLSPAAQAALPDASLLERR